MRLLLKIFICWCGGSLLMMVVYAKVQAGHSREAVIAVAGIAIACLGGSLVLLHKPWTLQNFIPRAFGAVGFLNVGLILTAWTQHLTSSVSEASPAAQTIIAIISFQGATIVFVTVLLREYSSSWNDAFGLSNNTKRAILTGVLVACLIIPIAYLLQAVSAMAVEHFTREKAAQQEVIKTIRGASLLVHRIVLGAATLLLAPLGEETLFRGILYSTIKQSGFPKTALWLTSIAFALVHITSIALLPMVFVPLLLLAICLTILYEKTDNLLAPIAAHTAFNAFGFVGTLLRGS